MIEKPPPLLGNGRVLAYAVVDPASYTGRRTSYVGERQVMPVPALAIVEHMLTKAICVVCCDLEWNEITLDGRDLRTVEEAKADAAIAYVGLQWIEAGVSREEAERAFEEIWGEHRCLWCGRVPLEDGIDKVVSKNGRAICNLCVDELHAFMHEEP